MNMLDVIKQSRSYREYKSECITRDEMLDLITAGRCAPSSNDEEPWFLVAILNTEKVKQLNEAINRAHQENEEHFHQAPCAIIVAVNEKATMSATSGAVATQNILLCAQSLNLASCWIDGVLALNDTEAGAIFKKQFDIPEGYVFYSAVALGKRVRDLGPKDLKEDRYSIIE